MPAPVTIPSIPVTWTPITAPADAYLEGGSATQSVGLGSAKNRYTDFLMHVSSIANLRLVLVTNRVAGSIMFVDGYYSSGDGGGGHYRWDSTSALADNGGTVIKPTGLVGNGRWIYNTPGTINVRVFGATGDGVTDDTAAIQAACDAATGDFWESVLVPKGSYIISERVVVTTRIRIFGRGKIVASAAYNTGVFGGMITIGISGGSLALCTIDGLAFLGTAKLTYGIYLYGVGQHTVTNCYFTNMKRSAVGGSTATTDCRVLNNVLEGVGDLDNTAIDVAGSRTVVQANAINSCISKGIALGGTGSSAVGNTIVYNDATASNTADGIYLEYLSTRCSVVGNTIVGGLGNGIKSTSTTAFHTITGNTVYKAAGVGWGIFLQGATYCTVSGNTIQMLTNKAGIYVTYYPGGSFPVSNGNYNTVSNNVVYGIISPDGSDPSIEGNSGILVYNNANDNSVSNNTIQNFSLGVEVAFAPRTAVLGNTILGCTKGVDSSTNEAFIDNNVITCAGVGIAVRGVSDRTKVRGNRVLSSAVQCLNVADGNNNVEVSGNTFKYTGADAVNVCFINNNHNLIFSGNNVNCPTTVANSVYIGNPTYSVVVGNITSGQTLNISSPDGFTQVANNVTLAPYYA